MRMRQQYDQGLLSHTHIEFKAIMDKMIQGYQDKLNEQPKECLPIHTPNQLLFGIDLPISTGL